VCSRVSVTVGSHTVAPTSVEAGPRQYRNAFGANWTVRGVRAVYDARLMRGGFNVPVGSPDGTEWPLEVPEADASSRLLIGSGLPSKQLLPEARSPPPQLAVTRHRSADAGALRVSIHSSLGAIASHR
jgi:hypothetical protein